MDTEEDTFWFILDISVDGLFFIDVLVNLCSSYYKADGDLEYSHRKVAFKYFKSWMILDLIACIPTNLIEASFNGKNSG